ncbi:PSD1 and planctomycete cytochrome C domain-containing protein [Planctomycetes bacterium TBK1r]|uniref:Planctomycete cytochrome C n=1 Tax=Stieleria magnilauensis TaxID=2527963 RepID=A0ABX5XQM7_9BACT|nr:Planctomycete cytochrome C [Planctomycetes bacterium TBK1r]
MSRLSCTILVAFLAPLCGVFDGIVLGGAADHVAAADVDFDSQVRPILSDKCFQCHGPDEATREADLRLDTVEGARADLGGYAAFVPHDPENSEGLRRVLSSYPDEVMPPPDSKLTLTEREKKILQTWVQSGATWSEHWSFVAPNMPDVPEDPSSWSRNEIDRFIRARAIAAGVSPQAEADRETLIRRVTLDLTGLPPTPQEVDAFLADPSDDAYERLVDRLLASPRYAERMAWDWLDAARYADTDGFQGDPTRTMWPWRDWLVDALNANMPFDQFTIEMLAGDLLDNPTPEQILATGFNRNHMFNGEGGRIAEETRVENVFDRAETTGTVWLGLTMTCCRCHDHKFDPISLKEYFQFYAFFDNTSETGRSGRGKTPPVLNYLDEDQRRRRDDVAAELQSIKAELTAPRPDLDNDQAAWEIELRAKLASDSGSAELGPWWQLGPIPADGRRAFDQDLGPESGVELTSAVGELTWTKRADVKDGVVQPLPDTVGATYFYRKIDSSSKRTLQLSLGSDDAIKVFFGGKEVLANFTARAAAADQERLQIELAPGENELLIKIVNTGGIGGFYFNKTSESVFGLPTEVVAAVKTEPQKQTPDQRNVLREHFRSKHWPQWKTLAPRRDQLNKQLAALDKQAVTVMVMDDLPSDRQRQTLILERGGYDKPTDVAVQPGTPAALPPLPDDAPRNRLTLARWLVSPANPLTARVTVNRYWQTFFGRGIVESTEDFGLQGDRPTHPDLLDWLATHFVQSGWNVKQLHKLIVMSATYRQSSKFTQESLQSDPQNKWFARAPRYRLPSWMLRDQALSVSGLLSPELGGPAVKPYQPEGIWAEATFGKIRYTPDSGEKLYRRSLYIFWRRIVGPTMFFDGAKRQTCEVKPTRTNTPLHALTTLNETTFVESARMMAQRVLQEKESQTARLGYAFRLATARKPKDRELTVLKNRVEQLRLDFDSNPEDALQLLSVGQSPRDPQLDPAEHAAYTVVCSILLNLDETLSKP